MIIKPDKEYKVSGQWLEIIADLSGLYDDKNIIHNEQFVAKRDFLVGRLVQEFQRMEWEEL